MSLQWIVIVKFDYKGDLYPIDYYIRDETQKSFSKGCKSSHSLDLDSVNKIALTNWKQWINDLGVKSAHALKLKEPITCSSKFIVEKNKIDYSAYPRLDYIFLMMSVENSNILNVKPLGFMRIGQRKLFFTKENKMVEVEKCFSILDFFINYQRQGFGLLLFNKVLEVNGIEAFECAFDRPTDAMISFLSKHFCLNTPLVQHNHFVIFPKFFTKTFSDRIKV